MTAATILFAAQLVATVLIGGLILRAVHKILDRIP